MQRKIISICAALVALAAFAVVPAIASASPVLTENGTALGTGESVKITAIGEESSEFTSGFISVSCNEFRLTGWIDKNSGSEILGNITGATFNNTGGKDCSSNIGSEVAVSVPSASWCLKANAATGVDKGIVEPHLCTGSGGAFTFILHVTTSLFGTQLCKYKRTTNIQGSFTTATPSTLKLENSPTFELEEGTSSCSSTGTLVKLNTRLYTDTTTEAESTSDPVGIS